MYFDRVLRHIAYWHSLANEDKSPDMTNVQLDLLPQHNQKFEALVNRFASLFSEADTLHSSCKAASHKIHPTTQVPIRTLPYRVSDAKKKVIEEQVQEMLKMRIIKLSTSSYASPVVVVPKKGGRHRFCADYQKLNAVTTSEPTAMPIISEVLWDLKDARVFKIRLKK